MIEAYRLAVGPSKRLLGAEQVSFESGDRDAIAPVINRDPAAEFGRARSVRTPDTACPGMRGWHPMACCP